MVGLNDNTSNLSILCKSRHDNWHIFQFTSSDDVELKRGSKLSGESVGYIYRDYFIGLADGRDGKKNHRGFFIIGAGHGDYEKTQRKTGEKISVTGLYVTLGGGSEYRFDNRLALSWSIGIAAGGVVTDRVLTGSVIYYFSE